MVLEFGAPPGPQAAVTMDKRMSVAASAAARPTRDLMGLLSREREGRRASGSKHRKGALCSIYVLLFVG